MKKYIFIAASVLFLTNIDAVVTRSGKSTDGVIPVKRTRVFKTQHQKSSKALSGYDMATMFIGVTSVAFPNPVTGPLFMMALGLKAARNMP